MSCATIQPSMIAIRRKLTRGLAPTEKVSCKYKNHMRGGSTAMSKASDGVDRATSKK